VPSGREETFWELTTVGDDDSKDVLRVVAFDSAIPVLEKRFLYRGQDGAWCRGARRPLCLLDLELILQHIEPITEAFRNHMGRRRV